MIVPQKCLDEGYLAHMITFRCNGGCEYCLVDGRGQAINLPKKTRRYEELSGDQVVQIWNSVEGHEGKKLSIIGGECTLHRDFKQIIYGLRGYEVTITSNLATPFYNRDRFWEDLKPPCDMRVNSTFHPCSGITAEQYVERVRIMRDNGVNVDQVGMVQHPALNREYWAEKFAALDFPMRQITYLGFWTPESGFASDMRPETQWPNPGNDPKKIMDECGIDDIERYEAQCGQPQDSQCDWDCAHGTLCFIVAPDGTVHECHYKLYYNIDPLGNALTGWTPVTEKHTCQHFGKCNWCDIPRLRKTGLDWRTHRPRASACPRSAVRNDLPLADAVAPGSQ